MKHSQRTHRTWPRALGAAVALLAITGCSVIADFRGFEIDGDGGAGSDAGLAGDGGPDAGPFDAGSLDAGGADSGPPDAGALDAGALDAGALDAGALDAGPAPRVEQVVAGDEHVCVRLSGDVYCMGDNRRRQVSPTDPTFFDPLTPVALSGPATQLVASGDRTCAILANRRVECWGANLDLVPGAADLPVPTDLGLSDVVAVGLGDQHACVSYLDESVECWGDGAEGQLGQNDRDDATSPLGVADVLADALALGRRHSCALLTDGTTRCWGNNSRRESGGDSATDFLLPGPRIERHPSGAFDQLSAVSCGGGSCCALSDALSNAGVYCWGDNEWSLLGPSVPRSVFSTRHDRGTATLIIGGAAAAVAVNTAACAIQEGIVYCWGDTRFGQLGDGIRENGGARPEPLAVAGLPAATGVAVSTDRSCAITDEAIYCWGTVRAVDEGGFFQEVRFEPSPVLVPLP